MRESIKETMSWELKADLSQWQPKKLISAAQKLSLPEFMLKCDSAFMLLVMVEPGDRELADGLMGEGTDNLEFRTHTRGSRTFRVANGGQRDSSKRGSFEEQTSERLPLVLSRATCHVLPIKKRAQGSFLDQVSVGRSRNHDIVLRHRSVSKFHATLQLTQDVRVMAKDGGSSNGTYLNDQRIVEPREVKPGDTIRFGDVEGRLITTEGLWRLIHR